MDRHDPNQWTKEFVIGNKDFCINELTDTNKLVIKYLKSGEHKAVITGLDRILNGLVTMINAGFDYRSQVCFFSWIEANVILFGNLQDFPEKNRIKTAKDALLDARDYAKDETTKNDISAIIDDINKGYNLSTLKNKHSENFPNFEIEALTNLNKKLENPSLSSAPLSASGSSPVAHTGSTKPKKKPWWLIIIIIAIALFVIARLFTQETEMKAPALEGTAPPMAITTEATTAEDTTEIITEIITEAITEPTTDANEAIFNDLVGNWIYAEISSGAPNPEGGSYPDERNEAHYTFYSDGRCSFGDARYVEAEENEQAYAEYIDGIYWICVGGGGQEGCFSVNGNQITITTDDSVQYGPSTTSFMTFTLDGDTLTLEHNYGTTVYNRTSNTPNEY